MHVTRAGVLACWLAFGSGLGCTEKTTEKRTAPALTHVNADAAAPSAPVDPRFVALARAALDAATALASVCRLQAEWQEDFRRYSDECTWKLPQRQALKTTAAAVHASAPDAGDASVFAEHMRLFAEWVENIKDPYARGAGTLAHYQDLAIAWNAFRPSDPVSVDLRTKVRGDSDTLEELAPGAEGHLVWTRCSEGPCLIVPRKVKVR